MRKERKGPGATGARFVMLVRELIKILRSCDPESEVKIIFGYEYYCTGEGPILDVVEDEQKPICYIKRRMNNENKSLYCKTGIRRRVLC